jgi:hypothetical protein
MVAFDTVGPTAPSPHGTSTSTLSWTHTPAASGATVLVGCSWDNTSDAGVTMTCKCDGVLMAAATGNVESDAQTAGFLQAWSIGGIASGARTILVTASSAAADMEGNSASATGAASVGTAVTANGTSTTASAAVAGTAASSLVFGFAAAGDSINSATAPATSRWIDNFQAGAGHATGNDAGSTSAGGGTVTMAWTVASSAPWAAIAIEVQAAAAPGAGPLPQYAPRWQPGFLPGLPGGTPFAPWPVWSGAGVAAAPQDLLTAATTVTASAAAVLDVVKAGAAPLPEYPPAWFPQAPGVPGGEPFAPWPAWSGFAGTVTPVDVLTAAATVTATGAASLTEAKPVTAAVTVTAGITAALTTAKPLNAAQTVTAGRAAAETTAKPVNAATTVTAALAASLTTVAAAPSAVTAPRLYVPAWFPGAPGTPAMEAFAPWPPWTGTLVTPPASFTVGTLTAATAATATLAPTAAPGSALTASTAPSGTLTAATAAAGSGAEYGATYSATYGPQEGILTASDKRTGGPG